MSQYPGFKIEPDRPLDEAHSGRASRRRRVSNTFGLAKIAQRFVADTSNLPGPESSPIGNLGIEPQAEGFSRSHQRSGTNRSRRTSAAGLLSRLFSLQASVSKKTPRGERPRGINFSVTRGSARTSFGDPQRRGRPSQDQRAARSWARAQRSRRTRPDLQPRDSCHRDHPQHHQPQKG